MRTIMNSHGYIVTVHTARTDAIQHEIIDPIEATGEATRDEYDIDAIADDLIRFHTGYDPLTGNQRLDDSGFYMDADDDDGFWDVVKDHANRRLTMAEYTARLERSSAGWREQEAGR